ncbi:hypothetical protein [Pseudooceanicola sp.]|uniref:hypothetical protein n=1 Tax=Pseudooceanicola sp. TaxID=1914328 RepID=UPI00262718D5|nr:hypothetical protein [Pseudooceanicola sp.]
MLISALIPGAALAHASEGGFVLLLPTGLYAAGGVTVVVLTVLLVALLPGRQSLALFRPLPLWRAAPRVRAGWISLLVLAILAWAVIQGWVGEQDPTHNPLPLIVWTGGWVILLLIQAILGDVWRALNPWTGLWWRLGRPAPLRYPAALGHWPAVVGLLALAGFLLADIAPAAPGRLAWVVALYWALQMLGLCLFGLPWLLRAEAITVMMRAYVGLSLLGRSRGRRAIGLSGWRRMAQQTPPPAGQAVFILLMLAIGSFDGVNETFWWFARIGMNPLEFTGRSAVVWQSLGGLALACLLLVAVFAATTRAGLWLLQSTLPPGRVIRLLVPSILPIALGYHLAHYLPVLLVEGQYLALMLNDPMETGVNLLGLAGAHVTTGFFNTQATVRVIWLTQAGAVVFGHVIAILMAHGLALRLFETPRKAALSQIPLAIFMVLYTIFGLWLLASPRGV